jgi:hypothetical protein
VKPESSLMCSPELVTKPYPMPQEVILHRRHLFIQQPSNKIVSYAYRSFKQFFQPCYSIWPFNCNIGIKKMHMKSSSKQFRLAIALVYTSSQQWCNLSVAFGSSVNTVTWPLNFSSVPQTQWLEQEVGHSYLCAQSSGRLCGLMVRVPGYRSGGPGSIPGTTRIKK